MKRTRLWPNTWQDRHWRFGFLTWFARRNLWEKRFRWVTAASIVSLVLVVALPVAVSGFLGGLDGRSRAELARNPLNLCLWARGGTDVVLTREKIVEIEQGLARTIRPEHLKGVYGFDRTSRIDFKSKDGTSRGLHGQTALWNDPVLTSIPGAEGLHSTLNATTEGIIITRTALAELGFAAAERPESLRVKDCDCRVLAIAEHPGSADRDLGEDRPLLPQRLDYLITERLYLHLQEANPPYDFVRLRPIPAAWQKQRTGLPPAVKKLIQYENVQISRDPLPNTWDLIQSGPQPWRRRNWQAFIDKFVEAMAADGLSAPHDQPPRLELPETDIPPAPAYYSYVGVYVTDLESLAKAALFCRAENLLFDDEVVRKLDEIGTRSREILGSLVAIEVLIALVAGLNLGIIQYLRHRQRMAEIGMLKAMGMSRAMLGSLAVIEGGMLWLVGTGLGLIVGCVAGAALALAKFGADGLVGGFRPPWHVLLATPIVAAMLSIAASLLGTAGARNTAPSETLRR
jgi:hypothetical protein